jgi:hypothetical protein
VRATRAGALRTLTRLEHQLNNEAGALMAPDPASAMRVADLVASGNRVLGVLRDPALLAASARSHATLASVALTSSQRLLGAGGARAAEGLVAALRALHARAPAAGGSAAGEGAGEPSLDVAALGRSALAAGVFRPAPSLGCLLGPLELAPKQRKAAVRRRREAVAAASAPEQLDVRALGK